MYSYEGFLTKKENKILMNYYGEYFNSHFQKRKLKLPRKIKKMTNKVLNKVHHFVKLYPPPQYRIGSGTINADRIKKL